MKDRRWILLYGFQVCLWKADCKREDFKRHDMWWCEKRLGRSSRLQYSRRGYDKNRH
jgi:hypothetical protein